MGEEQYERMLSRIPSAPPQETSCLRRTASGRATDRYEPSFEGLSARRATESGNASLSLERRAFPASGSSTRRTVFGVASGTLPIVAPDPGRFLSLRVHS